MTTARMAANPPTEPCLLRILGTDRQYKKMMVMRKIWSIVVVYLCLGVLLSFGKEKTALERAFDALGKYKKTNSTWDRWDFEENLAKAAEEGDTEAQYWYYRFAQKKPYKGLTYSDINISDSLSYIYLQKSADGGNLNAVGEIGLLYQGYAPGNSPIKKDWDKAFDYLKRAEQTDNAMIDLSLGYQYLGQRDTVPGSVPKAVESFKNSVRHGDKSDYWNATIGLAYAYFLNGDYKEAGDLYKKILEKYKKQREYSSKRDWDKIDENFKNPGIDDIVFATETFFKLKDYQSLNLIPMSRRGPYGGYNLYYPEESVRLNFSSWSPADNDDEKKNDLLYLLETSVLGGAVPAITPDMLRNFDSFKTFYSIYPDPDGEHSYYRSRYYRKIGDKERELEFLERAAKQDYFPANLILSIRYFYGMDGVDRNLDIASRYLGQIEKTLANINGNSRLDASDVTKGAYMLAMLYYSKDTPFFDYKKAVENAELFDRWISYSGDTTAKGDIYRLLAACYRFGRGVEADEEKADRYSAMAADYGDEDSATVIKWLNQNDKN